jgi:hypothetical protein
MTKRPTKREIRQQMDSEVEQYLNKGGAVNEYERGVSGLINGKIDERSTGFQQGKQERTPLVDALKAVDERKKAALKSNSSKPSRPKKKIIYDDFGEPVREVWVDS